MYIMAISSDELIHLLEEAISLEALGYNTRHAEDCHNQTDESKTHLSRYRNEACKIRRRIRRVINTLRKE